ncbi:MAG: PAS domain S-box protein [Bacteroidales bacterium]|jgi:PAS domain S-box-containing protein|nr:PAS domain S-box protein [Bacteroidales bacterium]
MNDRVNSKEESRDSIDIKLPHVLKFYQNSEFTIKLKARVFYYICLAAIFGIFLLTLSSIYGQINSPFNKINFPIIGAMVFVLLIFISCLWLLVKGWYGAASHMFMISANICVWFVMFIFASDIIAQIDTIVMVLAIINVFPLFINQFKSTVFVYAAVNIIMLVIFILTFKDQYGFTDTIVVDYLVDNIIAILFSGIAAYLIISIHNKTVDKIEYDYKKRTETEETLKKSEFKYRDLFENAQIGIYQTTPDGKILQANPALIKMLGFDSFEDISARSLEDDTAYVDISRKKFIDLIEKQGKVTNLEAEWKTKNGEIITIRENSTAVRDSSGKTLYYDGFVVDITAQKKALLALKESEEKYRTLMESLNEIIIVADNNHVVQYVNKKFTEVLGYTPSEIVGKIGYKILHDPDDYSIIDEANKNRINKNTSHYEMPFLTKDRRKLIFLVNGSPVLDAEGNTIASIGAMVDVTERKLMEKELDESRQLFQTLAQTAPVGIFRTDSDGKTTYINPRWAEIAGLSVEEAIGSGWLSAVHPDDRAGLMNNWILKFESSEKSFSEYRFLKPDGTIVSVLGNAVPEIEDGTLKGYIGTITNITELKQAQQQLIESEKKYKELADMLPVIIWESDIYGNCTYANNMGLEAHQFTQNEIVKGINILDLIIPEERERAKATLKARLEGKEVEGNEYQGLRKDGTVFPIKIYTSPIFEGMKPVGFRGANIDMTSVKVAEKQLKDSEEQLKMALLGANLGLWDWDMESNLVRFNGLFIQMLGYAIEDFGELVLSFDQWTKLLHEEDLEKVMILFNEHVKNKTELYEAIFRMKHKQGDWIWILARGKVHEWKNGKPTRALGTHLDITKNRMAEMELKKSEERYRMFIEQISDGIYRFELDEEMDMNLSEEEMIDFLYLHAVVAECNSAFLKMYNVSDPKDIIGKRQIDLHGGMDNPENRNAMRHYIRQGFKIVQEETIEKDLDGNEKYYLNNSVGILENGKLVRTWGSQTDNTARKKTEKDLKESEEKYRTIIEAFPDIIMISDLDSNIIFANQMLEKITGITTDDYSNPKRKAHIHPEDAKLVSDSIQELFETGKTHTPIIENRFIDSWGNLHWFSGIISRLEINNKPYIQTITRDITEKKNIEQELDNYRKHLEFLVQERTDELAAANEELTSINDELLNQREELEAVLKDLQIVQEQLFEEKRMVDSLMDNIPDAIYFKDIDSRFIKVSKCMDSKEGVKESLIGKTDFDLFTMEHAQPAFDIEQEIIKTGTSVIDLVEKETWKDGKVTYASTTKMPLRDASGKIIGTFGISRDITKMIQLEHEIKQQNDELTIQRKELEKALNTLKEAQNKLVHSEKMASLGLLASGVAHEINNPLNFIKGGVVGIESFINDNYKEHLDELAPLLEGMNIGVERAAAIVASLNHYNRRDDLPFMPCDIHMVINNCLVMLQNQIKSRIEIEKSFTTEKYLLYCNEGKIHQALLNIIANAVQAIAEKGSIKITTRIKQSKLHIEIKDSGCGMSKDLMSKILDPFFTTKEPGQGTGLGLSITYNIIQEHNGTIEFESKLNKGTIVKIILPLNKKNDE